MAFNQRTAIARVYKLCKYHDVHRCCCRIYWDGDHRRCFAARMARRRMVMRRKVLSGTGSSMCGMILFLFFLLYNFSLQIYLLSISFYSSPYIYVHTNGMGMAQSVTCGHCRHFYGHNQRTWGWRRSTLRCEANESQKSA